MNRVLVATLISERHEEFFDRYYEMVSSFETDNFEYDVLMLETTHNSDKLYDRIKKSGLKVIKHEWNPDEEHVFSMIADAKNIAREYFLSDNYTHYFSLDADTIIPEFGLRRLMQHNKDNVGFPTPFLFSEPESIPCVMKSGGFIRKKIYNRNTGKIWFDGWSIDAYSWPELIMKTREDRTWLFKVYAVGNGCLLSKRKVMEKVKWEVPKSLALPEDIFWYENVNQKGFEFWVDCSVVPLHKFVDWTNNVPSFERVLSQKIYIVHGYGDEKDFDRKIKELGEIKEIVIKNRSNRNRKTGNAK